MTIEMRNQKAASAGGQKVVVVDDSTTNRTLLRSMLCGSGYDVTECCAGDEALRCCVQCPPDIVLLDIGMPGIDGIQVCRALRESFSKSDLPIIIVTSAATREKMLEGLGK